METSGDKSFLTETKDLLSVSQHCAGASPAQVRHLSTHLRVQLLNKLLFFCTAESSPRFTRLKQLHTWTHTDTQQSAAAAATVPGRSHSAAALTIWRS